MKKLAAMALLVFLAMTCRAQITLKPGESWSYTFGSIPFFASSPGGPPLYAQPMGSPSGGFMRNILGEPGSACSIEVFEGGTNEAVFATIVAGPTSLAYYSAASLWSDGGGSLRFTGLTGSVTIASFRLFSWARDLFIFSLWHGAEVTVIPPLLPPVLSIRPLTNSVLLSWSTNGTAGFGLEATDGLESPAWSAFPQGSQVVGGRNQISVTTTGAMQFFRLKK
jgi:hypothetical protein